VDKNDVMTCRNFRNGTCPRSDPVVLEEGREFLQMGCRTCRGGWVVTLPDGKAKARYENRVRELKQKEEQERERRQRVVYFT